MTVDRSGCSISEHKPLVATVGVWIVYATFLPLCGIQLVDRSGNQILYDGTVPL